MAAVVNRSMGDVHSGMKQNPFYRYRYSWDSQFPKELLVFKSGLKQNTYFDQKIP